jgi:hypothetical protein
VMVLSCITMSSLLLCIRVVLSFIMGLTTVYSSSSLTQIVAHIYNTALVVPLTVHI